MNEVSLHPLVEALAAVESTSATGSDYVLADHVDVDAVRQLMTHADGT